MLALILASPNSWAQTASSLESTPTKASFREDSSLRSGNDGWLDMSDFIDQVYGFLPLIISITEPAVGFGAVGALAFIDKQDPEAKAGFGRPNISIVGGLATENGSHGVVVGDIRHWMDDRLQTRINAIKSSINLDYYGTGEQGFLNRPPRS